MISGKKTIDTTKPIEELTYQEYDSKEIKFDSKKLRMIYLLNLISSIFASFIILGLTLEIKILYLFSETLLIVILSMISLYLIKRGKFQKKLGLCLGIFTFFILLSNLLTSNENSYRISSWMIKGPNFKYYGISTSFDNSIVFYIFIFVLIFFLLNRLKPSNTKPKNGTSTQIFNFLTYKPSIYKKFLLLVLISSLTLFEEVLFRYLLINLIISYTNLDLFPTIMFVSLIFTLLHIFNRKKLDKNTIIHLNICFFYSIIFSITAIHNGLLFAWFLHFFWNLLLVFQVLIKK